MKIYKVYREFEMNCESDVQYMKNINGAIQYFNDLTRKYIKETDYIDKEYFEEAIEDLRNGIKEFYTDREIVCRKYPLLMYKEKDKLVAQICFWSKCSYEFDEWDIEEYKIVLEKIKVLD